MHGAKSTNGDISTATQATACQTIVETLEAPRLLGIQIHDFVEFREKRSVYERRPAEKNAELNMAVPKTALRNSIDDSLLKNFIRLKWVPESCISTIQEESIRRCIEKRSKIEENKYDIFFSTN